LQPAKGAVVALQWQMGMGDFEVTKRHDFAEEKKSMAAYIV
jgi:hypothetical protein